jgi:hypothetical protein
MAQALVPLSLRARLAALSPRERTFLAIGAGAVLLFLLYLLLRPERQDASVELVTPPITAPVAPPPAPLPVIAAPPPLAAPVSVPAAANAGVVLQGVSGGGPGGGAALFQHAGGGQRLVRVGREIVPGMVLQAVGLTYAIGGSAGSQTRFDLGKGGVAQATPALPSTPAPVGEKQETTEFRLGLEPVSMGGRNSGYRVRPGANLPRLSQAGVQPGDVITGVNGSALDEERLLELSWTLSNSDRTEFEVTRNGRKMKVALEPRSSR